MTVVRVEVLTGPMDGLTHYSHEDELVIGLEGSADLGLDFDPRISRRHARLAFREGRLVLEDLGSRFGTWIGAQRLREPVEVSAGAVFTVGDTLIEVLGQGDSP
ncbi:MAG: FHA domain-containing protein [Planctomycetes bacterium]|nr:FHA domain-containing protein [Planctomycetota bacterium]MBL7008147.1 FHA domain-containing protein [Planctomycetota bacterium]